MSRPEKEGRDDPPRFGRNSAESTPCSRISARASFQEAAPPVRVENRARGKRDQVIAAAAATPP